MSPRARRLALFHWGAWLTLVLCQLFGLWVDAAIARGESKPVFSWLFLTHIRNLGGIFGILQGLGWLFALSASVVLALVLRHIHRHAGLRTYEFLCYGLVVGGGSSNILDRFVHGSVIDYFDVRGIPYWGYIFNLADVAIHLGIWPILAGGFLFSRSSTGSPAASSQSAGEP